MMKRWPLTAPSILLLCLWSCAQGTDPTGPSDPMILDDPVFVGSYMLQYLPDSQELEDEFG